MDKLLLLVLGCLVVVALHALRGLSHRKDKRVTYLVTLPPLGLVSDNELNFFEIVHNLLVAYHRNRWLALKPSIALEITAQGERGIRFLINCPTELSQTVRNYLLASWPELEIVKVRNTSGYTLNSRSLVKVHRWRLKRLSNNRPRLSYLLAGMHGLDKNETVAFQMIISPYLIDPLPLATKLVKDLPIRLIKLIIKSIGYAVFDVESQRRQALSRKVVQQRETQSLFAVTIRSLVIADGAKRVRELELSNCSTMSVGGMAKRWPASFRIDSFLERRHRHPVIASAEELSSIYYFPSAGISDHDLYKANTVNVALPAVRQQTVFDIVVGMNDHNGQLKPIGLDVSSRKRHMMIIGATGMGKTTMLKYMLVQDLLAHHGLAVIDPHGDLASDLLRYVPADRIDEVIYLDPADIEHPVGLNLLELPNGLSGAELEMAKDFVTEAIISIFRKVFSDDDSGGHRIEYILRNTIHSAFYVTGANLFTLHKLLTNDMFRAAVVSKIDDESLRDFWYGEFNKAGSYQRVKMIAGVTAKLGRFQRSVVTRRIIGQQHTTIDFDDILKRRQTLICNLSKGAIGEDTSSLLGMVILAKLQLAVWRRSLIDEKSRKQFYLYIDEFQSFASHTLSQLVSESRKYGISITLAEQTTASQQAKDSNILLANIGNIVCFRLNAPKDIDRLTHLFEPAVARRDLTSLSPYWFYIRQTETSRDPIAGKTMLIADKGSGVIARKAISSSRKLYSSPLTAGPPVQAVVGHNTAALKRS